MRNKSFRTIGGLILLVVIVFGIGGVATSVQARRHRWGVIAPRVVIGPRPFYPPWYGYRPFGYPGYNQYIFGSSARAFNQGFKDGLSTGRGDAKHNRSYDPERSYYFQDAGFGNFGDAYRHGFMRGYEDGFRA